MRPHLEKPEPSFLKDHPAFLREVLWNRGFRDDREATHFLHPSLAQIPNPLETLLDVNLAVSELLRARDRHECVVIFGDYDVDGTTSTVLLHSVLKAWEFRVEYFVPHRIQDGYGVTKKAAEKLIEKYPDAKLIVTCDCGIGSFEGVQYLKDRGARVVVTDHHEPPSKGRVAAEAVLNPKQKNCAYPDKKLAGVGVAFLLLIALRRALDLRSFQLNSYLDLVATGTVCDVAELVGVNRIFVKLGLSRISETRRLGLQEILRRHGLDQRKLTTRDLGFVIGPRLNAAGRVGDPSLGVRTLIAERFDEAMHLVSELEEHNLRRRQIQDAQVAEALKRADEILRSNPAKASLVISDAQFHLGIVGLIASRLSENYQRPICVLTEMKDEHALADYPGVEGLWKGSLRAPIGYHLAQALSQIPKGILVSGGGHAQAAGVALIQDRLDDFVLGFEEAVRRQGRIEVPVEVDAILKDGQGLSESLQLLEPFGNGNPAPLVYVDDAELARVQVMKEIHLRLQTQIFGQTWSVLQFKSPWVKLFLSCSRQSNVKIEFLAELSENEWNGNKRVELQLKDLLNIKVSGKEIEFKQRQNEASQSQGA